MSPRAAIVDIDGTLVDTNYQHAIAWQRAFAELGYRIPAWRIHRHVGMGGDKLVEAIAGEDAEKDDGDRIREVEADKYQELIGEVVPLDGARDLLCALKELGLAVVLASSAKEDEVDHYLDLLEVREVADDWTTSADVDATKPDADLVESALEKAGTRDAVMLGDTPWDVEAAERAGLETVTVLTGGFSRAELEEAGSAEVYKSPAELLDRLADSILGGSGTPTPARAD